MLAFAAINSVGLMLVAPELTTLQVLGVTLVVVTANGLMRAIDP
jgi:hypothetical protein